MVIASHHTQTAAPDYFGAAVLLLAGAKILHQKPKKFSREVPL
jgi:hypothetical protein